MTRAFALLLYLACTLAASGAHAGPLAADRDPSRYAYDPKPGAPLPVDPVFHDADGHPVHLPELAQGVPLILVPAYLRCPNLCGQVRASLLGGLRRDGLEGGRDYVLAVLSIDPTDAPADAGAAKAADVSEFGADAPQPFWHYLTGTAADIAAVTAAVGFRNRYDPDTRQFVHPAGIVFLTADGRVSNYLLGAGYTPVAIRAALHAASVSRIAAAAAPVLLICFHFDPTTGRYSLEIMKVLRLLALLTVMTLVGTMVVLRRRERDARSGDARRALP